MQVASTSWLHATPATTPSSHFYYRQIGRRPTTCRPLTTQQIASSSIAINRSSQLTSLHLGVCKSANVRNFLSNSVETWFYHLTRNGPFFSGYSAYWSVCLPFDVRLSLSYKIDNNNHYLLQRSWEELWYPLPVCLYVSNLVTRISQNVIDVFEPKFRGFFHFFNTERESVI